MFVIALILLSAGLWMGIGSYATQLEWQTYKRDYGRKYESMIEETYRNNIFEANLNEIRLHNREYELGLQSYEKEINEFSDMTEKELKKLTSCNDESSFIPSFEEQTASLVEPELFVDELPTEVDYRSQGAVTSVKYQGYCGSCWAFSAIAVMESHQFLLTKKLVSLSAQNLVDCTPKTNGCKGGFIAQVYNYIVKTRGIASDQAYPYKARDGFSCSYNESMKAAVVKSAVWLPKFNETEMQIAIALHGPLAVSVHADHDFYQYKRGIFYSSKCQKTPNHAVVIVGYGTDSETRSDYWIVKNSWGKNFGENGYIRMARNRNNTCNIASRPSYPVMERV